MESVNILGTLADLANESGIAQFLRDPLALVMVGIACFLIYLAIVKKFEPLLLLPIAFGMLLTNLLGSEVFHESLFAGGHANWSLFGGAILVESKDLVDLASVTVNNAGAILNSAGQVIGQITENFSVGATLNAAGALIAENGTVLADSVAVIIKDSAAFMTDGQVYSSVGTLLATDSITDRYLGYTKAMLEHHLPIRPEWILPDRDPDTGLSIPLQFPREMPTAFVCNCDFTAAALIDQLKAKGLRVPYDVSVVGFDNYLVSGIHTIPLTTYSVDLHEMAHIAVRAVLKRILGDPWKLGMHVSAGELIDKGSVRDLKRE